MIVLYTTQREYPYGTLRSTNSSSKVILEEKGLTSLADSAGRSYLIRIGQQ